MLFLILILFILVDIPTLACLRLNLYFDFKSLLASSLIDSIAGDYAE